MTAHLHCDSLIFQTLEDLEAACLEAADDKSKVTGFETGVFCGRYQSPVPSDYLERSRRLWDNKKRKLSAVAGEEEPGIKIASSGTAYGPRETAYRNGV